MATNYSDTKILGFDLDQTLYPKSPEIDEAIQIYLYHKIADHLKISLQEAETRFKELYRDGRGLSGSTTMATLGIPNPKEVVQEALENAEIEKFLIPDQKTLDLLAQLKQKYRVLDIITGSNRQVAMKKLQKLNMDQNIFDHVISADDGSKRDSSAFKIWMGLYPDLKPTNFLYVGDRVSSDHEVPKKIGIQTILVNQKKEGPDVDCLQLKLLDDLRSVLL